MIEVWNLSYDKGKHRVMTNMQCYVFIVFTILTRGKFLDNIGKSKY